MSSIRVERYSGEKEQEWNAFNKRSRNALFMFDRGFMDYHSNRFMDCSLLFFSDDKLIALLPMNEKDGQLISHGGLTYGGFIFDEKMKQSTMLECFGALREYASNQNYNKIIYKKVPYIFFDQSSEEDEYALYKCGGRLMKLEPSTAMNLDAPLEMATLRKRKIRKAQKEGIQIIESNDKSEYGRFLEIQNEVLSRHGVKAVHTTDELWLLHTRFPQQIRLFFASLNGQMIGGTTIFEYNKVVHTQYLCADEMGRNLGALDLTIESIMERYKGNKKWLDFGISSEQAGLYLNEGLISQKEGFCGRTLTYKTWELDL